MVAEHQRPFDAGPPLRLVPLATHETSWAPSSAKLAMHATLDACIVPDANGAARVDTAHVVVLVRKGLEGGMGLVEASAAPMHATGQVFTRPSLVSSQV